MKLGLSYNASHQLLSLSATHFHFPASYPSQAVMQTDFGVDMPMERPRFDVVRAHDLFILPSAEPVNINGVWANDSRFVFEGDADVARGVEAPANTEVRLGAILFDPSRGREDENYMPKVRRRMSKLDTSPGLTGNDLNETIRFNNLFRQLQRTGKTNITAQLNLKSEGRETTAILLEASLLKPTVLTRRSVEFPLTQQRHVAELEVTLRNPSRLPLLMELAGLGMLGELPLSSVAQAFGLKPERLGPLLEARGSFAVADATRNLGSQARAISPTRLLLEPYGSANVTLQFRPETTGDLRSAIVVVNNLTIVEPLFVSGRAGKGSFGFPKTQPHIVDGNLSLAISLRKLGHCLLPGLMMREEQEREFHFNFTVVNRGTMPVKVRSLGISGTPCQADGFRIVNCEPFELPAKKHYRLTIAYRPDYTTPRVTRKLTVMLQGAERAISFPMVGTVPKVILPECFARLRPPTWAPPLKPLAVMMVSLACLFLIFYELRVMRVPMWTLWADLIELVSPTMSRRIYAKLGYGTGAPQAPADAAADGRENGHGGPGGSAPVGAGSGEAAAPTTATSPRPSPGESRRKKKEGAAAASPQKEEEEERERERQRQRQMAEDQQRKEEKRRRKEEEKRRRKQEDEARRLERQRAAEEEKERKAKEAEQRRQQQQAEEDEAAERQRLQKALEAAQATAQGPAAAALETPASTPSTRSSPASPVSQSNETKAESDSAPAPAPAPAAQAKPTKGSKGKGKGKGKGEATVADAVSPPASPSKASASAAAVASPKESPSLRRRQQQQQPLKKKEARENKRGGNAATGQAAATTATAAAAATATARGKHKKFAKGSGAAAALKMEGAMPAVAEQDAIVARAQALARALKDKSDSAENRGGASASAKVSATASVVSPTESTSSAPLQSTSPPFSPQLSPQAPEFFPQQSPVLQGRQPELPRTHSDPARRPQQPGRTSDAPRLRQELHRQLPSLDPVGSGDLPELPPLEDPPTPGPFWPRSSGAPSAAATVLSEAPSYYSSEQSRYGGPPRTSSAPWSTSAPLTARGDGGGLYDPYVQLPPATSRYEGRYEGRYEERYEDRFEDRSAPHYGGRSDGLGANGSGAWYAPPPPSSSSSGGGGGGGAPGSGYGTALSHSMQSSAPGYPGQEPMPTFWQPGQAAGGSSNGAADAPAYGDKNDAGAYGSSLYNSHLAWAAAGEAAGANLVTDEAQSSNYGGFYSSLFGRRDTPGADAASSSQQQNSGAQPGLGYGSGGPSTSAPISSLLGLSGVWGSSGVDDDEPQELDWANNDDDDWPPSTPSHVKGGGW